MGLVGSPLAPPFRPGDSRFRSRLKNQGSLRLPWQFTPLRATVTPEEGRIKQILYPILADIASCND
jgi:hypothetical protein